MSVFADGQESSSHFLRHLFVGLGCLLGVLALCRSQPCWSQPAAAKDGDKSATAKDTTKGAVTQMESGRVRPTLINDVTPEMAARMKVASPKKASGEGKVEKLVEEKETPADYKKIAEQSTYPAVDTPDKLTPEQLDAISKLPPKYNKLGQQVHPAMVPLFRKMTLYYTGGKYHNEPLGFRLHVPDLKPGKKYPLVVWLHGAGECGSDNLNQLSHLHHIIPYLVGPKKRDFFLLVSQCPHGHSMWEAAQICKTEVQSNGTVVCHMVDDPAERESAPIAYTLAMTDAVMKQFPIDPHRVTIAGLSTGGDGTWRALERRPDLFAAAAPIVSWQALKDKFITKEPSLKKIPIWAIYSSDDNGIDYARREFNRVRDAGCHAFKTEFSVCGHRAWTPAMLQGDVFGWLVSRAKDGERFYAAEASPTTPEKIGGIAEVTVGDLAKHKPTPAVRPSSKPAETAAKRSTASQVQEAIAAAKKKTEDAIAAAREKQQEMLRALEAKRQAHDKTLRERLEKLWQHAPAPAAQPTVPAPAVDPAVTDELRITLIRRYIAIGEVAKALAVADKVKNRRTIIKLLLGTEIPRTAVGSFPVAGFYPTNTESDAQRYAAYGDAVGKQALHEFMQLRNMQQQILDYVDREIDRLERGEKPSSPATTPESHSSHTPQVFYGSRFITEITSTPHEPLSYTSTKPVYNPPVAPQKAQQEPLKPIPDSGKPSKDNCGKEWAMSSTTQYGLFPNGWDQEATHEPDYIVKETGDALRARLQKAFRENDLAAMREFCNSFILLDDIPLSSPWFDTAGGRLKGRIQYSLNAKAKPVVAALREIAADSTAAKNESKKPLIELAQKAIKRIDAITQVKAEP